MTDRILRIVLTLLWAGCLLPLAAEELREPKPPLAEVGRQLIVNLGCTGCHAVASEAFRDLGKAGPDLRRIAAKTTPAWALSWVMAPRKHRPTTWMPHFLEEADRADGRSIVAYLWEHSLEGEYSAPPAGQAPRGEALFNSVGCTGCHLRDAGPQSRDDHAPWRLHGPNLLDLGRKVKAPWLFAWLKNPHHFAPETRMPDLRLSDQEAADLMTFLLADSASMPEGGEVLPWREDEVEAGREAIDLYSCYGCHLIDGFEEADKPGGLLESAEGFTGHGLAGLPDFKLSDLEVAAIRAALVDSGTDGGEALAAGRRLVAEKGCRGCHLIEGQGQAVAATLGDDGLLPPNLHSEGARVQPTWLRGYLRDPTSVSLRPWLSTRMPTYALSEGELQDAVAFFEALEPRQLALRPQIPPGIQDIARGREVFDLMLCGRCHPKDEKAAALGLAAGSLGPPLGLARGRLRYEWIGAWIEDPQSWSPGTKMPAFFELSRSGGFVSPFVGALDSPPLADTKARLQVDGSSAVEIDAFLTDAGALMRALCDYVWSLGAEEP